MIGDMTWAQVLRVPAPTPPRGEGAAPADQRAALLPALTAAHSLGEPIAVLWHRDTADAPIRVHLGGGLLDPAGDAAYPPGVGTTPTPNTELAQQLGKHALWLSCTATFDNPHATTPPPRRPNPVRLEDLLAHLGGAPFAWLLTAQPVPVERTRGQLDDAHYEHEPHAGDADRSLRDGLAARQLRNWHTELAQTLAAGRWDIRVAVAGPNQTTAQRAGRLLCATGDLADLHYRLAVGTEPITFDQLADVPASDGSADLIAAIGRPPVKEIPGVRAAHRPAMDLTPEIHGPIPAGHVLDLAGRVVADLTIPLATINRHTLVVGATGAGKTRTVRNLLGGLHQQRVPWLVIEPAKAEYAALTADLDGPTGPPVVIRPSDPDSIPVSLNPLTPEPGFPLQTHLDLVRALFLAAFDSHEPFPQVLSQALTRCYQEAGWDLTTGEPTLPGGAYWPSLADLQDTARDVVTDIGYGAELAADVAGFVDVRLTSLRLGGAAGMLEGGHPIDIADLLSRDVIVELEDIGDDQDKAFLIGALLLRVTEHLRVRRRQEPPEPERLRHVTVIEEAHRLLRAPDPGTPAGPARHAVEMFAALLAEIRADGEGIIVAEQIPTKLIADVVKNTALKLLHRLPAADDRELVGAAINLTPDQSRHVVSLPAGEAVAFADGMDRPVHIAVPLTAPAPASAARGRPPTAATNPGTLRTLTAARRLADDERLAVYIDLLTLAHLTGEPRPDPHHYAYRYLAEVYPTAVVEAAIKSAVDTAIRGRHAQIAADYPPEDLATHLITEASDILLLGTGTCLVDETTRYLAGRARIAPILRALRDWTGGRDAAHPDTARWAALGIALPRAPIDDQLTSLDNLQPTDIAERGLILGRGSHLTRLLTEPDAEGVIARWMDLPGIGSGRWTTLRNLTVHAAVA